MVEIGAANAMKGHGLPDPSLARLRKVSNAFEASFLAEMLKSAGLGKVPDAFGGGVGEDQFASFLRQEQASAMVHAGGIGLSQTIFDALVDRADGR